jgi:predicted lipid-binding transport protein (Tim44 family)
MLDLPRKGLSGSRVYARASPARMAATATVLGAHEESGPHHDYLAEWEYDRLMGIVITLIIVGIVLLIFGVAVKAAMFLLWIGIILLVVGAIMWVMRSVRNRA